MRPLYLINCKSRLYFEKPESFLRRSAQNTLWIIARVLSQLWAPILSFFTEQINDELRIKAAPFEELPSIHLQQFERMEDPLEAKERLLWISLEKLRKLVTAEVEAQRKDGVFARNEYARVTIQLALPLAGTPPTTNGPTTDTKQTPKKKKGGEGVVSASLDDDCLNIQRFLNESFASGEGDKSFFLRSYFNVSQCEIEFLQPTPADTTDHNNDTHPLNGSPQQSNNNKNEKGKKEKNAKVKKKKEEGDSGGSGAALKDRIVVRAVHASGKLCCRCDIYYDTDTENVVDETTAGSEAECHGNNLKVLQHLGLCEGCRKQLGG